MKRWHSLIVTLAAVIALTGVIYGVFLRSSPAPAVVFTTLKGERISTAELKGRVVLVNFWATDCPVCVKEMPDMVSTYTKYRDRGLELVAVAMRYDPPNYVIHYTEKTALPFKVALDPMGQVAKAFGDVRLTPTTFVIDREGRIVSRILGQPDFAELERLIEKKLGAPT